MEEVSTLQRRRFRYSIRSILLAMAILGLVILVVRLWLEVGPLRDEVRRLRVETGQLTIEDPSKIHGFPIVVRDRDTWRWRLYLPPGRTYRLYSYSGTLPDAIGKSYDKKWFISVLADARAYGYDSVQGGEEIVVDCQIVKADGQWVLKLSSADSNGGTSSSGSPISQPSGDWLSQPNRDYCGLLSNDDESMFEADEPVLLLHLMRPATSAGIARPRGPTDGVAVWIESDVEAGGPKR